MVGRKTQLVIVILCTAAVLLGLIHWRYGLRPFFGGQSWRSEWCAKCGLRRITRSRYIGSVRWRTTVEYRRDAAYHLLIRFNPECNEHQWVYHDGACELYNSAESAYCGEPWWMFACDDFEVLADKDRVLCEDILRTVIADRLRGNVQMDWDVFEVIRGVQDSDDVAWLRCWWRAYKSGKPISLDEALSRAASDDHDGSTVSRPAQRPRDQG